MSDPLRTDNSRELEAASDSDRDAKIEQLLLVGLDHYFSGEYEHAVNVWTRALFLDRSHARARAYIERARSALAEQQRESEELLQRGVAAFERGEPNEARHLLHTALSRGAPSEEALVVLDRLNRMAPGLVGAIPPRPVGSGRSERARALPRAGTPESTGRRSLLVWILAFGTVVGAIVVVVPTADWWLRPMTDQPTTSPVPIPVAGAGLPLPRRGEAALDRARALSGSGHLHEALAALDGVKATDQLRPEADQLRARIQRDLLALASRGFATSTGRNDGGASVP